MRYVLLTVVAAALLSLGVFAGTAGADKPPAPPGQGECAHGNSLKPCKEDPQPEKGKDCEEHGPKEGGVNEDHCLGTTDETTTDETTTEEVTTSTTETTETTFSDETSPTTSEPSITQPGVTQPSVTNSTPTPQLAPGVVQAELEKELEKQAQKNGASAAGATSQAAASDELPRTGLPLLPLALLGGGMVGLGGWMRRR